MSAREEVAIEVEVVYALPERQLIVDLQVPHGTTVREAAISAGLQEHFEGLDPAACKLGIFGRVVDPDRPVEAGDRIELYRPLLADPKEVRRALAAEGKTMGRRRDHPAQESRSTTRSTTSPSK